MAEIVITLSLLVFAMWVIPAPKGLSLFRPSTIVSFFIFVSLLTNALVYGSNFVHPEVMIYYISSCAMFVLGDFASVFVNYRATDRPITPVIQRKLTYSPIFVLVLVGAVIGFLITIYLFVHSGLLKTPSLKMLAVTLRREHEHGDDPTYGAFQLLVGAQAIGSIFLINESARIRRWGYAFYAFVFFSCLVKMERTGILMLFASMLFLAYYRRRSIRVFIIPSVLLLSLFTGMAFMTNKLSNKDSGFFLFGYMSYGIHAFDAYAFHKDATASGENVLGSVGKLLVSTPLKDHDSALSAGTFNVFTYIQAPYADFGVPGIVVVCLIFGLIWGLVFNAMERNPVAALMYSWMIFPCIMVFYAWQFSLTTYIYLLVCYLLLLPRRNWSRPRGLEFTGVPLLAKPGAA